MSKAETDIKRAPAITYGQACFQAWLHCLAWHQTDRLLQTAVRCSATSGYGCTAAI